MANVDFEKDEYVIRWLTGLSKGTKDEYPKLFRDWLTFIGLTPTEQIQKRMHDLVSTEIKERCFFEDKWREYKQSLESTGTNSDSKVHDRIKVVSSFFTRNSLPLALKKGDWKSTQKQEVITPKFKLNLDDVKRMYGHANLRDKCLLLILAQSGFSEVDISEQKIEGIKDLYTMPINEHYVIEKPREKTNHVQQTCLSYEFLHDLRDLLAERGNPQEGYIFISQTKQETETQLTKEEKAKLTKEELKQYEEQQAQARKEAKEKGLNCIDTRRINESMKALAEKTFGKEKAKDFQTKALRSFYNSALLRAKIQPQELKNRMMGHEIGVQGHHDCDDETIREAYIMAFEHLSINGLQSREDLAKIKADLNRVIGEQHVEIQELKQTMNNQAEIVNKELSNIKENLALATEALRLYMEEKKQQKHENEEFHRDGYDR